MRTGRAKRAGDAGAARVARALALVLAGAFAPTGCTRDVETSADTALAQHRITAAGPLLDAQGTLREPGWATRDLLVWDPARVADASKLRQWDFFTLMNGAVAVNLTLADVTLAVGSVGVVDLATGTSTGASALAGSGELALSAALGGDAALTPAGQTSALSFAAQGDDTLVTIDIGAALTGLAASGTLTIHRRPALPFLSLATPFPGDPHAFFYEQKLPGLSAEGTLTLGSQTFTFGPDTLAVMDWGRGQWPPVVAWQWAWASGTVGGKTFALNLGSVFGDDRAGTENIVFYDDVASKLGRVTWSRNPDDLLADWTFTDDEGRLSLVLHPVAPEVVDLVLVTKYSHVRKAYGAFSGTVLLDGGERLALDGVLGAAEVEDAAW